MEYLKKLDTPVLLIVFNRPQHTQAVLDSIKKAAPNKLYVAADGPRTGNKGDIEKCASTRKIFDEIDWPCEVKTLFRHENLGCKRAVSGGISWFFEHEPQGIILEDDCNPDTSFFFYCQEILNKYKNDTRVMHVAGTNHFPSFQRDPNWSYYFSQVGHIWGWATWRRAWAQYDIEMSSLDEIFAKDYFKDLYPDPLVRAYFKRKFRQVYRGEIDTWDYQWEYSRLINSGLSVVPKNNMISNIGFGDDATHTASSVNYFQELEVKSMEFPLQHPPYMIKDYKSEKLYFRNFFKWIIKRKTFAKLGVKGYSKEG